MATVLEPSYDSHISNPGETHRAPKRDVSDICKISNYIIKQSDVECLVGESADWRREGGGGCEPLGKSERTLSNSPAVSVKRWQAGLSLCHLSEMGGGLQIPLKAPVVSQQ